MEILCAGRRSIALLPIAPREGRECNSQQKSHDADSRKVSAKPLGLRVMWVALAVFEWGLRGHKDEEKGFSESVSAKVAERHNFFPYNEKSLFVQCFTAAHCEFLVRRRRIH